MSDPRAAIAQWAPRFLANGPLVVDDGAQRHRSRAADGLAGRLVLPKS